MFEAFLKNFHYNAFPVFCQLLSLFPVQVMVINTIAVASSK